MAKFVWKAKAAKERNFDRSFVLFGKACSGKSTLGNLLLGGKCFKAHKCHEAASMTRQVYTDECKIEAHQIYDTCEDKKEMLKIQIIDQPGSNDSEFKHETYCEFLKQCITMSKSEMSATFLILIDLDKSRYTDVELISIFNLADILTDSNYSFFPNAIIVFTHADRCDKYLNENNLEGILKEKLQDAKGEFTGIQDLMDLVDNRYIFINGTDTSEITRYATLKKLFKLSRCSLTVYINGNNGFRGNELKKMLKEDPIDKNNHFEKKLLRYDLDYHFNPDLNLFRKLETKPLGEEIEDALYNLRGIGTGIETMVLLISLEEMFNEEISELINELPDTFMLDDKFKENFWDYGCILFKVANDKENFVKRNVEKNTLLKEIVTKVNYRYGWLTSETNENECSKRILELVKKVKLDSEGKAYFDNFILTNLRNNIQEATGLRMKATDGDKMIDDIKNKRVIAKLPFYNMKEDEKSVVRIMCNDLFMKKSSISMVKGYFILKKIDLKIAKQFREEYEEKKQKTIPNEEYATYCINAISAQP